MASLRASRSRASVASGRAERLAAGRSADSTFSRGACWARSTVLLRRPQRLVCGRQLPSSRRCRARARPAVLTIASLRPSRRAVVGCDQRCDAGRVRKVNWRRSMTTSPAVASSSILEPWLVAGPLAHQRQRASRPRVSVTSNDAASSVGAAPSVGELGVRGRRGRRRGRAGLDVGQLQQSHTTRLRLRPSSTSATFETVTVKFTAEPIRSQRVFDGQLLDDKCVRA
jgi:hypothetical protein